MRAPAELPGLSVVIVSWNAASVLGDCLSSILSNPPERMHEVLVLDNGSRDGSPGFARGFGPVVKVVEFGANRGFAGACNEGSRMSRFGYLLFLNPDVRVRAHALESLCRFMDSHPEVAAAGGKLVGPDGLPQTGFNVRAFPTLCSAAFEILMLDKVFPANPVTRRQRMLDLSASEPVEVDQPAGACLLVRKDVFREVGLFDERFHPAWFEDVDLCLRLRKGGHRIYFFPDAEFEHRGGVSLEKLGYGDFLSIWYRNLCRYFFKHRGAAAAAILRALIPFGMLERMVWVLLFGSPKSQGRRAALAAYWQVLRSAVWPTKDS